ncbi:MAG: lytic transglycosylase domain-containing protein [Terracidiphilus sp.]|nr:lytic transglycosylase domain-containing protein [Terracidiphilus sp.]
MLKRRHIALVMAACTAAPLAYSGERATLRNGFAMQCDHHATVDGHLRLYLGTGDASYIELKPEEVSEFEFVPDSRAAPSLPLKPTAADKKLSAADLNQMLSSAGTEHNVDIDLLASVVKAESGGNTRAVSRAGARGLMQLMPSTAADLGVNDAFKPNENVRGGSAYLDQLLTRYHDNVALALAAYNAGPAAVDKYHGIPPYHETRAYVARVIHEFNRRVRAHEIEASRVAASSPSTRLLQSAP